jgi:two-component system KDP operon response regulator KdpE
MAHQEPMMTTESARILVIDDEPGIRSFAARALSAAGFAVAEAAGGHQGLRAALTDPPDLVLLDLGLPDLDGEQVLRHLIQQRPHQAVLVWSATADHDAKRRCLSLGAHAYLRKPVSVAELLSCITHECPHAFRADPAAGLRAARTRPGSLQVTDNRRPARRNRWRQK